MKVALAQINTVIGDLEGNVQKCLDAVDSAIKQSADLVVLPEMAIPGYPPRDILYDRSFCRAITDATEDLAFRLKGTVPTIVGTAIPSNANIPNHPCLYNAAVLLEDGIIQPVAYKRLLPTYDVFFESRWFIPGEQLPPIQINRFKVGVIICEDLWDEGYSVHPGEELVGSGAELLVCIAASPYRKNVIPERLYHARRQGSALVFVNLCGGNDELIFDGSSFVMNKSGIVISQTRPFEEGVCVVDLENETSILPAKTDEEEEFFNALILGVRDFAHKNRITNAFLGLSGGIDSAIVAVIATKALGKDNVTAVAIPSRYTDSRSTLFAKELAISLGIHFREIPLEEMHSISENVLSEFIERGTTGENLQARLRAVILMAMVNHQGGMLLNCSNKTELALGYSTIYGDMTGVLSPIGDLTKSAVYKLAKWIRIEFGLIPEFILERDPTAELRPGQIDPFDYDQVSPAKEQLVMLNQSDSDLRRSEYKRWQMGVILRVTEKAFGRGRMIPITRR